MNRELTSRKRVLRAIRYETVDLLPTQVNDTGRMGEKLAAALGVPIAQLLYHLGNHLFRLDLTHPGTQAVSRRPLYDAATA